MLYAGHGRAMLAYATRLTGDRAAAESVVQQALVLAWRHADRLTDGSEPVRARLLVLVRDLATEPRERGSVELACSRQDRPHKRKRRLAGRDHVMSTLGRAEHLTQVAGAPCVRV